MDDVDDRGWRWDSLWGRKPETLVSMTGAGNAGDRCFELTFMLMFEQY